MTTHSLGVGDGRRYRYINTRDRLLIPHVRCHAPRKAQLQLLRYCVCGWVHFVSISLSLIFDTSNNRSRRVTYFNKLIGTIVRRYSKSILFRELWGHKTTTNVVLTFE